MSTYDPRSFAAILPPGTVSPSERTNAIERENATLRRERDEALERMFRAQDQASILRHAATGYEVVSALTAIVGFFAMIWLGGWAGLPFAGLGVWGVWLAADALGAAKMAGEGIR